MRIAFGSFSFFVLINMVGLPVNAASSMMISNPATNIEHGGGCRKSSPPGKCCHGGSQPVHCH
ncbi:MAG: hypothetical protein E8G75_02475 [Sulfitobacter sp. SK025]|jgi:hypothetical protein|nr:hypothetical protein [Roseobacter sp.]MBV47768.1 hypothetical protein [Roseobacter sp.]PHR09284.1 MAG: hypothetical protein COB29_05295 [Sulfitobacter sp.]THF93472.1 MAG: hypothetical protein E8G75_02475 [Sulfitobacter sp. SK025]